MIKTIRSKQSKRVATKTNTHTHKHTHTHDSNHIAFSIKEKRYAHPITMTSLDE